MLLEDANGNTWAFGYNNGKVGDGTSTIRRIPVRVKINSGTNISGIDLLSSGRHHVVARDMFGQVYVWGDNDYKQLGGATGDDWSSYPIILTFP